LFKNRKATMSKSKTANSPEQEPNERLSKKEFAKQFRHEAYLRAKEYRRTDPRQIAMKEKQKDQRKEAYQKGKERRKVYQDEIKKALKEKSVATKFDKRLKQRALVTTSSTLKQKE
jgi:hypothetical protein